MTDCSRPWALASWRALLLLGTLALLPGCCTDPVNGERYLCLVDMTVDQEVELGRSYAADFTAQSGGAYPDASLNAHLSEIVLGMARKSHRPDLPWTFTVLNTSQINAFALPGGAVFVTRGLLVRLHSEAQFAQLMGHEIGHVSHRHAVRGQNREAFRALILGAVAMASEQYADPDVAPIVTGGVGLVSQLTMLHYSREQELQSDSRGIDYAVAAGYDPREAKKTFEMFLELKQASGQEEGLVQELLATHPPDSKRIAEIDSYLADEYPNTSFEELEVSTPSWQHHLASVQKAQRSYEKLDQAMALISEAREASQQQPLDRAEALIREGAAALPKHAPFPATLGLIALERDDANEAQLQLDRACRLDPGYFQARYYRGLVQAQRGQTAAARADMAAAQQLFPSHPLPCYHLGALAEKAGDSETALSWYVQTLARSADDSAVYQEAQRRVQALRPPAS